MRALVVAVALSVCGCPRGANDASGASSNGSSAAASSNACWPITPLTLEALEHGAEWEPIASLQADGTFVRTEGRKVIARLANDQLMLGGDPLTCDAARTVRAGNAVKEAQYDAQDAFVDARTRIFVRDDGEIELTLGGEPMFDGGKRRARVVGDVVHARRTAELLVLVTLASARF
ncbi:MAG: hypothetical protein HYV09_08585 [Deltaproteobacteria bacterium]|nr:hypothetical protein [Deltaproteobacteria bacterium]